MRIALSPAFRIRARPVLALSVLYQHFVLLISIKFGGMATFIARHPAVTTFATVAGACLLSLFTGINIFLLIFVALLFSWYFCNLLYGLDVVIKTLPRDIWALYCLVDMKVRGQIYHRTNNTVIDIWERTVGRFPNKDAFICDDIRWSFSRVDEFANKVGHFVSTQMHLQSGDTIALFITSRPEYVGVWLGVAKVGCVSALINFNLRHESLLHCIRVANARALIVGKELMGAYLEIADQLDQKVPVFCIGGEGEKETQQEQEKAAPKSVSRNGVLDLDVLLPRMQASKPQRISADQNPKSFKEKLLYVYTSGTTGMPKAAVITNARFFLFARGVHCALSIRRSDILYTPLPLYHTAGGIIGVGQVILHGSTMVIRKKFSASRFWDDCVKYKCTVGQYVGELCRYLLAQPEQRELEHNVRLMFGNGMRQQVWREFQARFAIPQIGEFYGATESNANLVNFTNTPGSCGFTSMIAPWAYPVKLIRTDPETGLPLRDERTGLCIKCKVNEPGELVGKIKTNSTDPTREFHGYVDASATNKKLIRDVFKPKDSAFLTGDLLVQDKYGCMFFCDRMGDTFRWKGENVSTTEVEGQVMKSCQKDCVVFGVEVPNCDGKAGMACIVTADARANDDDDYYMQRTSSVSRVGNGSAVIANGDINTTKVAAAPVAAAEIDLERLLKHLYQVLPPYAVPNFIRLVSRVEQTGTFKLKKSDVSAAGYDPSKTHPDPVYFLDAKARQYKPVDESVYHDIQDGKIKF